MSDYDLLLILNAESQEIADRMHGSKSAKPN
jgi:RNA polymerase subunit RPABC4/transcription elongation factor Spt4